MTLPIDSRLGPYEILGPIGAGGMGEVYRARDTKLGRDVALKVLPEGFARDAGRLARFQREAKLLASLNHPNIASLFGFEDSGPTHGLVMELAEGPTLADRIGAASLPVEVALPIARQIADALEYAHERGVVHRDLKPANIKISPEDSVKILDFGLAKAVQGEASESNLANSPTISQMATGTGVLLGTAAYMSPEQAKGRPVDRRADIWAFGCVLYEMLTGEKAFEGETVPDTLGAILRAEPDWSKLPAKTPMRVRALLERCLRKDPKQRLRDIGEARLSIDDVLSGVAEPVAGGAAVLVPWRVALPWAVAAALFVAVAWLALLPLGEKNPPVRGPVERFEVQAPNPGILSTAVLSPDGTRWVMIATSPKDPSRLWLRRMDSLEAHPIDGTDGATGVPFWSPDSRFVVFGTLDGKLKKLDTQGGPAQVLSDSGAPVIGGFWTLDNRIIFSDPNRSPGLWEVSASGGRASALPGFEHAGKPFLLFPMLLPDGKHFLYASGSPANADIYLASLDRQAGRENHKKLLTNVSPRLGYALSRKSSRLGYLLYLRTAAGAAGGTLMAQPFSFRALDWAGEPVPVAEGVSGPVFSASVTGTLIYGSGRVVTGVSQPGEFDRQGKLLGVFGEPGIYSDMAYSPDGNRIVASRLDFKSGASNLWMIDLRRGVSTRFTFGSGSDSWPVWSPDGSRIVFASLRDGASDLYVKLSNGGSGAEMLFKDTYGVVPASWSRDGRFLLFWGPPEARNTSDVIASLLPLDREGRTARKPFPFVQKGVGITERFSPGREGHPAWVAYSSDESGRFEIYVRPFDPTSPTGTPPGGGKWQVSTEGGLSPRWNGNGKELFYVAPDGMVMSVDVSANGTFRSGIPKPLFRPEGIAAQPRNYFHWDASSDGKRFIFPVFRSLSDATPPARFTVILNWPSLLEK